MHEARRPSAEEVQSSWVSARKALLQSYAGYNRKISILSFASRSGVSLPLALTGYAEHPCSGDLAGPAFFLGGLCKYVILIWIFDFKQLTKGALLR